MGLKDFEPATKLERMKYITEFCLEWGDDYMFEKLAKDWNRFYKYYPELVARIICDIYGVRFEELKSKSRNRKLVESRQMFFFYMMKVNKCVLATVGEYFGKDHATVLHGVKTFKNLMDSDKEIRDKYYELQVRLKDYEEYL